LLIASADVTSISESGIETDSAARVGLGLSETGSTTVVFPFDDGRGLAPQPMANKTIQIPSQRVFRDSSFTVSSCNREATELETGHGLE